MVITHWSFYLVVFCEKENIVDNVRSSKHQSPQQRGISKKKKKNEHVETCCCHRYLQLKQKPGSSAPDTRKMSFYTYMVEPARPSIGFERKLEYMCVYYNLFIYIGNINIYLFYAMDRIISIFSSSIIDSELRSLL